MAEKNILAFYRSPDEAEGAAAKMRALRAIAVSVDRLDAYPGDGVERMMNPITGDFPSLGFLTLGADFSNNSMAILGAANVSASGMSDGGEGGPTGRNILLTAVVDESSFEQAMKIVEQTGGQT